MERPWVFREGTDCELWINEFLEKGCCLVREGGAAKSESELTAKSRKPSAFAEATQGAK